MFIIVFISLIMFVGVHLPPTHYLILSEILITYRFSCTELNLQCNNNVFFCLFVIYDCLVITVWIYII